MEDIQGVENTEVESQVEGEAPPQQEVNELAYEKGVSLSDKLKQNPNLSDDQISDLDKLDKIRYNGKVYTGAEFAKLFKQRTDNGMTLEKYKEKEKAMTEERKYISALKYDLPKLKANPALIDEFKRVYPAEYHDYLDLIEAKSAAAQSAEQPAAAQSVEQKQVEQQSWKQDPEFKEILKSFQEQKVEAARTQVNTVFDKMAAKYPYADDSWVANRVAAEREQMRAANPGLKVDGLDEKLVEKYFKESSLGFETRAKEYNAKLFNAQKTASEKAKGPGSGGGVPGGAPKVAKSIAEATEFARQDPFFQ